MKQRMKSIIIVDDDLDILDVFKLFFERAGYIVTIFSSAEAVMDDIFKEPDIFIIDKQLSGADGLGLCKHLKNRQPPINTPVIIFSASPHIDKLAKDAGADDFIEKPFRTKSLLQLVEKHLNKEAA
jgi:DNA-binding response OmpR family regulator